MDLLNVNNPASRTDVHGDFKKHTMAPTCTGTSVIGIKFKDGVVLAADMLVSYGSLARYMDFERMFKVNKNTVMCCSGDVADFQFLKHHVEEQTHLEGLLSDGFQLSILLILSNIFLLVLMLFIAGLHVFYTTVVAV
ncbi:unnamed protein product [Heterobilharzia americana]|nr:unnamed protein product [Heterobilharzia americana]